MNSTIVRNKIVKNIAATVAEIQVGAPSNFAIRNSTQIGWIAAIYYIVVEAPFESASPKSPPTNAELVRLDDATP